MVASRTKYPNITLTRDLLIGAFVYYYSQKSLLFDRPENLEIFPTEVCGSHIFLIEEINIPQFVKRSGKLNVQYLTVGDFLCRSFQLYKQESFYEIKKDIEEVIRRIRPQSVAGGNVMKFQGTSSRPAVGEEHPAYVRAEVQLELDRIDESIRREWENLKPGDSVFLMAIQGIDAIEMNFPEMSDPCYLEKVGLKFIRCAQVDEILDQEGRPLKIAQQLAREDELEMVKMGRRRLLRVKLDTLSFYRDQQSGQTDDTDVYAQLNVIMRRKSRQNNFKPILDSIKQLSKADIVLPDWLEEIFLGFGDPTSAHYTKFPDRPVELNFLDTFLDWQHLTESFDQVSMKSDDDRVSLDQVSGPFILDFSVNGDSGNVIARQYKRPNSGPFASDKPRQNTIRFTPMQVQAIVSGSLPGLTVVVGPPGTGKTDVACQIVCNIYHNFPQQRTLLVAHSNQALNQLFEKIAALDISERHLLRLGHGEEDLKMDASYGRYGRERRLVLLTEVAHLAQSLNATPAHGNSCETAGHFFRTTVEPVWKQYESTSLSGHGKSRDISAKFPFANFFHNAPQPLFDAEGLSEVARGCWRHIENIFIELSDIHPFEILRSSKERSNYLLVKEARIIALTATHAAMNRQEFLDLGFRYDNVIIEEAAQILEIEAFIPLTLQHNNGKNPIQRLILFGDHNQMPPVVQNIAFKNFSNMDQSLFSRFIRLGVASITLDRQGRCRPSLAKLYQWRYPNLGNLVKVETEPIYKFANAGFKYDFQFIQVDDYRGQGEQEPSPHFIQNLGEAEYAVSIYQYMRLLGYPGRKITILTMYAGQKALIRDILNDRCTGNPMFGFPGALATVDQYQGDQNDYIILSLVRTQNIGYLRDVRRLTVAVSRARLGLYVLGRRNVDDDVESYSIETVEHAAKYIFEMATKAFEYVKASRDSR
ncbi:Intron-binding protein aquarius [Neolecta irregularis DAH-3]|uniref:Intron-binding protein aquarius n=1 Tax=Neolecta irregularis (strain DAH-3) TaxID=1198029 RepID=A0A1U7LLQ4_NEOID|nr:Intron-binding protein aquarius [Neolecta irregularis DAH-3]|eukprot:OLL23596.1 Intron-binding protein aquarius [Neolecta irregularis DAH-3]